MGKVIGIQKELNEIAEALTVNGFEVTNMLDTDKKLDAIIYYNDESSLMNKNDIKNSNFFPNNKEVLKINAAKTNIDKIMKILNNLR
ncbi:YkuS family protein [Paramaledivibacter caminithermalis]|uniref:Uncharacterized protein family (UPF0180) n=1 Tax=Paramaledivibacter caminithermalis (strain DSM 15212 / CIP 107654 / DViRD3) TaxID=1121301 RepID=A0A1M6R6E6_PARC5|nr:YkuS family protein [Paramaledivibacter caminithermalis]SHK27986.1 Uncharacterised protein family (UPF0180) [Paramaledivibacter caminithermalis DSM 15212]